MVGPGFLLTAAGSVAKAVALFAVLMAHVISSVSRIKDPFSKSLAWRIQCLSVQIGASGSCIANSCMKPVIRNNSNTVVHPHCFGSFYLEWGCTYPLLEEAGLKMQALRDSSMVGYMLSKKTSPVEDPETVDCEINKEE